MSYKPKLYSFDIAKSKPVADKKAPVADKPEPAGEVSKEEQRRLARNQKNREKRAAKKMDAEIEKAVKESETAAPKAKKQKKAKPAPAPAPTPSEEEEEDTPTPQPPKKKVKKIQTPSPPQTDDSEEVSAPPAKKAKVATEKKKVKVAAVEEKPEKPPVWLKEYVHSIIKDNAPPESDKAEVKKEAVSVANEAWNQPKVRNKATKEVENHMSKMFSVVFNR